MSIQRSPEERHEKPQENSKPDQPLMILSPQNTEIGAGLQRNELSKNSSLQMQDQGLLGKLMLDDRRITAPNKDSKVGAPELPKPTVDSPDFRDSRGPASIRNNNPGAMYPGESARKFGSTVTHTIGGGHKIAEFPDAISGAVAQFDLLNSDHYRNKTVASAIAKWCGHTNPGAYNRFLKDHGIDTKSTVGEVMADKDKAIALAATMARVEAGKDFPLNKAQWGAAFDKYKEHATEHAPPASRNHDVSNHRGDSSHHHHSRGHHNHNHSHHHHRRRHH